MNLKGLQVRDDALLDLMKRGMVVVIRDEDGIISTQTPIWMEKIDRKSRNRFS